MTTNVRSTRVIVVLCALSVISVLGIQLVAATAWQAGAANSGPTTVVLQLSADPDTEWATKDLMARLSAFITDDLFFPDRLILLRTDDPSAAKSLDAAMVIYMSHGGPQGIVTGNHLTSWKTMADIVSGSTTVVHLFSACESRRLIKYGAEDSGKKLYTVPGIRPAEVTNVEIASTVMLALGISSEVVENYRTTELTRARDLVQSGESVHLMDFEQVVLDQIDYIDAHYSDTYTEDYMVLRSSALTQLCGNEGFVALPLELQDAIVDYYRLFLDDYGIPYLRTLLALSVDYTKNYYQEANWISDPGPESLPPPGSGNYSDYYIAVAPGHWECGPLVFCGGTYTGVVVYSGDWSLYTQVWVNVTASGSVLNSVDSISLNQIGSGGVYVTIQKVNGTWEEPTVGRSPGRTGGLWTDPGARCDYEYDSSWPVVPGLTAASGAIGSTGNYLYVSSIPTGTGWHGPSFVQTLPSYFKLRDLGSFSANLSLFHGNEGKRATKTCVSLYDSNKKLALCLGIEDTWFSTSGAGDRRQILEAYYYNELGTAKGLVSDIIYGNYSGIVQIRFDPLQGLFADVPGKDELWLYCYTQLNVNRLIKYVAIQSYRYGSSPEHDERIRDVRLSFAFSDYTVFHDVCNDMCEFNKDLTFGYGTSANGTFEVPAGQSYMKLTSVMTGSGWHGPDYVHVLDRPFRLYQLSDFSVIGSLIQSSSTMGLMYVGLFDEYKHCVLLVHWGDAWSGSTKGWFNTYYYNQDGSSGSQGSGYIYTTFTKTGKLWWDPGLGGQGVIYSQIDGQGPWPPLPIATCDNASRVIKYVVLYGAKYSSYNLVDMRILDINVVADLTRHNPTAPDPVENDGTRTPSAADKARADAEMTQAQSTLNIYLTGPWPLIHYVFTLQIVPSNLPVGHPAFAMAGLSLVVHEAKNILGYAEQTDVTTSRDGSFLKPSDAIREWLLDVVLTILTIDIRLSAAAFEVAGASGCIPALILTAASLAASVDLMIYEMEAFTNDMIARGKWTQFDAACLYAFWGVVNILNAVGFSAASILRNKLYGPSPVQVLEEAIQKVKGPSAAFTTSKVALVVLMGIAIWCFIKVLYHLNQSL